MGERHEFALLANSRYAREGRQVMSDPYAPEFEVRHLISGVEVVARSRDGHRFDIYRHGASSACASGTRESVDYLMGLCASDRD